MMFFEKNMEALEKRLFPSKPEVLSQLLKARPAQPVETARAGCPTIYVRTGARRIALHSTRDPVREAEAWVRTYHLDQARAAVLAGFALGYACESILRSWPEVHPIIVIEPNIAHLAAALRLRDLTGLIADERIRWFIGRFDGMREDLNEALSEITAESGRDDVAVLVHSASVRTMPDTEKDLQDALRYLVDARRASSHVMVEASRANIEKNADAARASPGVSRLFGRFAGTPAFLIAPGPSLMKSFSLLSRGAAHALFVTLDAALMPLARHDLPPDFVLTADPQPQVRNYFPEAPAPRTHLVFFSASNPDVVELFAPRRRFVAVSEREAASGEGNPADALFVSGSVFLSAMDFCARIGCDPIILVGSDLAVKPGRSHVDGSPAFQPASRLGTRQCEGYFGIPASTSDSYYLYLRSVEEYIERKIAGISVWNATEGGARIRGAAPVSLRDALTRIAVSHRPDVTAIARKAAESHA